MENIQPPTSDPQAPTEAQPDPHSDVRYSPSRAEALSEGGTFDVSKSILPWIKHLFDYLGASHEEPPPGIAFLKSMWWPGLWWGLLAGLILLFCGQTSKFIYIDF